MMDRSRAAWAHDFAERGHPDTWPDIGTLSHAERAAAREMFAAWDAGLWELEQERPPVAVRHGSWSLE